MSRPAAAATRSRLWVAGSSLAVRCSSTSRRRRGTSPFRPPPPGGGEELFGEEGVAFGASDDRVGQRGWRGGIRVSREQRRQLLAPERAEFEQQPRTRAPDTVGEPAHAPGRGQLVRAISRQQQNRAVNEVMGEENDEIER